MAVSIADATLASSQPRGQGWRRVRQGPFQSQTRRLLPRNGLVAVTLPCYLYSFNRRRDACFLATATPLEMERGFVGFQSQTRRLLPRNVRWLSTTGGDMSFNRRRDACFLATRAQRAEALIPQRFQSQTRRLLPRN